MFVITRTSASSPNSHVLRELPAPFGAFRAMAVCRFNTLTGDLRYICIYIYIYIWNSEDRASWYILIIKPKRCTNFSNLFFLNRSLHVSDRFSVRHQESTTVYTATDVCHTVLNSWWWAENLSETCTVLFKKWIWEISSFRWFYYKNICVCVYIYIYIYIYILHTHFT